MFQLCYHQHGGSGLNFTYADVMGMSVAELDWYYEKLADTRAEEARRLASASRRR